MMLDSSGERTPSPPPTIDTTAEKKPSRQGLFGKVRELFLGKKSTEKKEKKIKWYPWLIAGVLGVLAIIAATEQVVAAVPYADNSESARRSAASQAVEDLRIDLQETGEYSTRLELIDLEIRNAVNRLHNLDSISRNEVSTGIAVERFVDEYGQEHVIHLINAHAIPSMHGSTMWIYTQDGPLVGHGGCVPYDFVGHPDVASIVSEPIRDLAFCDTIMVPKPETATTPALQPLPLDIFQPVANFPAQGTYFGYGFPLDKTPPPGVTIANPGRGEPLVAALQPTGEWKGEYQVLGGEPFGSDGASGGPIIHISEDGTQHIVGIMAVYNVEYPLNSPWVSVFAQALWRSDQRKFITIPEFVPADIVEKIQQFKQMAQEHSFPQFDPAQLRLKNGTTN